MRGRAGARALTLAAVVAALAPPSADLKPETLAAFERYVALTETRMAAERRGDAPLLWLDRQSARDRAAILERLRAGKVEVMALATRDGRDEIDVPDGLIHHWIGTVLLPGTTLPKVMAFVQDYDRYAEHFAPTIVRSKLVSRDGVRFVAAIRTSTTKAMVTAVVDADYVVDYEIGERRVWAKSVATNLFEVHDAGTARESRTPAERGRGFMYRLNNYCAFEVVPEGVIEQCESISLSRDIPWVAAWLVGPFVRSVPREALEFTLGRVRAGLQASARTRGAGHGPTRTDES